MKRIFCIILILLVVLGLKAEAQGQNTLQQQYQAQEKCFKVLVDKYNRYKMVEVCGMFAEETSFRGYRIEYNVYIIQKQMLYCINKEYGTPTLHPDGTFRSCKK